MRRATTALRATLTAVLLGLALLVAAASAGAAEESITYAKEALPAFETQLSAHQIAAATFNKRVRSMRVTLKDGEHKLVIYKAKGSPALIAKLEARHVRVTILSKAAAEKEAKAKPKHHKIRYIAGAVVIAVIVIAGLVLLISRRRRRD
jgi:ABC-type phosphate transport system substrate-binding protein